MSAARCAAVALALACAPADDAPKPAPPDPRAAAAWVELGDAARERYRATQDAEQMIAAETAYRLGLERDPGSADALAGLAWVRGVEHAFEESLAMAERALALDPAHRQAHGILADAALALGRLDLAEQHVQAMLDLRPDLPSLSRAALLLERRGERERAVWFMQRAIATGDPRAEATAWCRKELGRMLAVAAAPREAPPSARPPGAAGSAPRVGGGSSGGR